MDSSEARAHLNYLLTLGLRREEAFGPMALSFIKEEAFDSAGLLPEEQFSLIMATVQALAQEPKRYNMKLEMLKRPFIGGQWLLSKVTLMHNII